MGKLKYRKEQKYRDMYDRSIDAMHKSLLTKGAGGLWIIGSINPGQPGQPDKMEPIKNMEHLTCFTGGMLALGAYYDPRGMESERARRDMKTAKAITYTCYQM